eukprot:4092173-Pyramimonas_sp.AAC.1
MEIRAGEQVGFYRPTHGSGMGDGSACELFVRSFLRPVERWRDRLYEDPSLYQSTLTEGETPLIRAASV